FTVNGSLVGSGASAMNISISDEVGSGGGGYSINETTAPGPAPPGRASFHDRYVKVLFTGDLGINSTTFHWSAADLSGVSQNTIRLFTWNGTGWILTPNQTLDTSSNSLTALNLLNITSDDIYGLFHTPPGSSDTGDAGGGGLNPAPSLDLSSDCSANILTVTSGGTPLVGAAVEIDGDAAGTTNSSGQLSFDGCGRDVTIRVSKSGYSDAVETFSLVGCGLCVECSADTDCPSAESCVSQQCVPVPCACGVVSDHMCVSYECCADADCPAGEECSGNSCQPVLPAEQCTADSDCPEQQYCDMASGSCRDVPAGACGEVRNHAFVPYGYECGTEPGCPGCPEGAQCVSHECVQADVSCPTAGKVGDEQACEATENGQACANCDFEVTDPSGKKSSGRTDNEGNFNLPLTLEGTYRVALLRDGQVIKTIEVKALPKATPEEPGKPAQGGTDAITLLFLALLVLLIIGAIIYWRGRQKK
ncbi:MAG: hypothetical protein AB1529_08210, partial [Candidatus Micrarchaeota archaeon]